MYKIKKIYLTDYSTVFKQMKSFIANFSVYDSDEFWLLEHKPVFTFGVGGKAEHMLVHNHGIEIVHSDRGGQVTYHGPGQLVVYTLLNLTRLNYSIRHLVENLEIAVMNFLLCEFNISATNSREAPGVYVDGSKICSLGLRKVKDFVYHGISLNINMNLTPFNYINVCGYPDLSVTQISDLIDNSSIPDLYELGDVLLSYLIKQIYEN